jgi:hypothetical protein
MSAVPLPYTLLIGGLEYAVRTVPQEALGPDRLAQCDDVNPVIDLSDAMPYQRQRQILFHEGGEGILNSHFLEISHEQLSVLMTETLRVLDDNPKLRGYLWPRK